MNVIRCGRIAARPSLQRFRQGDAFGFAVLRHKPRLWQGYKHPQVVACSESGTTPIRDSPSPRQLGGLHRRRQAIGVEILTGGIKNETQLPRNRRSGSPANLRQAPARKPVGDACSTVSRSTPPAAERPIHHSNRPGSWLKVMSQELRSGVETAAADDPSADACALSTFVFDAAKRTSAIAAAAACPKGNRLRQSTVNRGNQNMRFERGWIGNQSPDMSAGQCTERVMKRSPKGAISMTATHSVNGTALCSAKITGPRSFSGP